jgi:threonine aldolase
MLTVRDFEALGQSPGAILLELPYRPLGGSLPDWDDLCATRDWASARGIPVHMDGARIWSCRPFYGRDFAQIAALFDSVYVSFYKDIGGLGGAMLLGTEEFVRRARMWLVRHGGRLFTMAPYMASARHGLHRVLSRIDGWVTRAKEIAAVFGEQDGVRVKPDPPHTNMFQVYLNGNARALSDAHMRIAEETGTFLFRALRPSVVPGVCSTEIHCWENAMLFDTERLRPFLKRLMDEANA